MDEKRAFNKGDFIKYKSYGPEGKVTFGIFEGVDLAPEFQYTKKLSLVAYYDSHKYSSNLNNGVGWGYAPCLEVATNGKECEKTVDTLVEDNWWSLCTPLEKRNAIEILSSYGYQWDEELLSLVDIDTGEIIHKIIVPKIEYNGETIKPICQTYKEKLKHAAISQAKQIYSNSYQQPFYHCYNEYYYD